MAERAPAGLGTVGKALWKALTGSFEFDQREVAVLTLACRQLDDVSRLEALLARDGLVVEGSSGQPRLSAVVSELRQSRVAAAKLLAELAIPADVDVALPSPSKQRAKRAAQVRWDRTRRSEARRFVAEAAGGSADS